MKFVTAWRFLTIVPLPFRHVADPDVVGTSTVYFPVVGLIIGLILAGLGYVFDLVLPQLATAVLIVIAQILITGGTHLDGTADTFDGLGGSNAEERRQIMRDSHTGSFGVISIASIIALKVIFLILVPQSWFWRTLIVFPLIGRGTVVYAIALFPYARPSGLGKLFKEKTTAVTLIIASIITLLVAGLLLRWAGLLIAAVTSCVVTGIVFFFRRKFSGLTGDNYGAIIEIAEVTVLLMVVLLSNNNWLAM